MVNDVEILEHLGNSDQNIIVWKLICEVGLNTNSKLVRKYHKADHNSMRCIDWAMEGSDLTVEEMWLYH